MSTLPLPDTSAPAAPTTADLVGQYFEIAARRFDTIYDHDKTVGQKIIDSLFHGVVHRRFELTLEHCGQVDGKKILEVGCGSGRYGVELALRGADVTGVDLAPAMIEIAQTAAAQARVADRCHFETQNFLEWCEPHHFEISLGIGLFDYISDPFEVLSKMRAASTGEGIFSFPIRWTLRSFSRWIRLTSRRCPVYFYDRNQVTRMVAAAGWDDIHIRRLSRDYLVFAKAD